MGALAAYGNNDRNRLLFVLLCTAFLVPCRSGCGDEDWQTTCVMAKNLTTFSQMRKALGVNGIKWSEINRRAVPVIKNATRPMSSAGSYDECDSECFYFIQGAGLDAMVRSFSGFIAKNETVNEVLMKDWVFVHNNLRSSHVELAGHLRAMLGSPSCTRSPFQQGCNLTYNASTLHGNTIRQAQPQRIHIDKSITNGCQCSLFWNNSTGGGKTAPTDPGLFNDGWSCTYRLTNLETNLSIASLGASCDGTAANGTVLWIEQLGFYEGSTPYRIAPQRLYELVQGADF